MNKWIFKMNISNTKKIVLSEWVEESIDFDKVYETDAQKAQLAIELSRLNIEKKSGGPFGAAIFDGEENKLLSVGVNTVAGQNCSINHAEILAIIFAEEKIKSYRLDIASTQHVVLVSSSQPCAMCFGAIIWAGIKKLIYCSNREDVIHHTGFDEGPLPDNWIQEYQNRNIEVFSDVLRNESIEVLKLYKTLNGLMY